MRAPRVCFVAPFAWPILSGDAGIHVVGGAEVQQVMLARGFARRGWSTHMICMDHGQPDGVVVDGVVVHRMHKPDEGIPVLRFIHPRFTSLWRALTRADADILYQRAAGAMTAFVAAHARRHGRKAVFAAASDMDFVPMLPWIPLARDRALFRWGIRRMDAVLVQTAQQQAACRATFGIDAVVSANGYDFPGGHADAEGPILWVGTVKALKQPLHFVDLARAVPQRRFVMIGGGDDAAMDELRRAAQGVANLEVRGFVPFSRIEPEFDGGAVLVNTSTSEGFPNTFLQAWSRGMPSLSYFDPGIVAKGQPVAATCAGPDALACALRALLEPQAWATASARCAAYARSHLSAEAAVERCAAVFERVRSGSAGRALERMGGA